MQNQPYTGRLLLSWNANSAPLEKHGIQLPVSSRLWGGSGIAIFEVFSGRGQISAAVGPLAQLPSPRNSHAGGSVLHLGFMGEPSFEERIPLT